MTESTLKIWMENGKVEIMLDEHKIELCCISHILCQAKREYNSAKECKKHIVTVAY